MQLDPLTNDPAHTGNQPSPMDLMDPKGMCVFDQESWSVAPSVKKTSQLALGMPRDFPHCASAKPASSPTSISTEAVGILVT